MTGWSVRPIIAAALTALAPMAHAQDAEGGERITVTGELIDTWCYFSGVMGPPESTIGTAHHTCALWCSAGGIPVGLLAEDGTVYMVLKIEDSAENTGGDTFLNLASHTLTAEGLVYERDGLNYLVVEEVVSDEDIAEINHDFWGPVPSFAIPEPE